MVITHLARSVLEIATRRQRDSSNTSVVKDTVFEFECAAGTRVAVFCVRTFLAKHYICINEASQWFGVCKILSPVVYVLKIRIGNV